VSDSVRALIVAELQLPADWTVIPEARFPDTLTKTTVVLQHTRIERLPEGPLGALRNTVTLTVADPRTDVAAAEDALDDALVRLIGSLDRHSWLSWTEAEKVVHAERYVAWNLTLTALTSRDPNPQTEEV